MYVQNKYYKILELSKYDDIESIKMNYKRIIFENHPDRGGDENFAKEVNFAWEIIKKHHVQQTRQSNNQKTNKSSKGKHTKNTTNKNKNKTKNSSKNNKSKTKKNYSKNKGRCSRYNSEYEPYDVYCYQCGHKIHCKEDNSNDGETAGIVCVGVIVVGIGILFLSLCWPFGIIYFYLLYKYLSS